MKKRITIATILSICVAFGGNARSVNGIALDAASSNRDVKLSTLQGRSEVESMKGENMLPDPSVELEQLWGPEGSKKLTIGVSQEFQFPSVYSSRSHVAREADKAIESLRRAELLDKALEAKLIILEIIYNRNLLSLMSQISDNMETMKQKSDRSLQNGEISVLEHRKIIIDRAGIKQQISGIRNTLATLEASLDNLAGGTNVSKETIGLTEYPAEPFLTLDEYRHQAETMNPRLDYNRAQADVETLKLKAIKAERLPNFSLGYIYNREEGVTFNGLSFGMSLPLYSAAHKKAAVNLQRESFLTENTLLTAETDSELAALHSEAQTLKCEIDDVAPVFNNNDNLILLQKAFEGGEMTIHEFLSEVNYFSEAEMSYLEKQYIYATTMAKLNKFSLLGTAD